MNKLLNRLESDQNAMGQDLDMGGFFINNTPKPTAPTHTVRLQDVNTLAIPEVVQDITFATTMTIEAETITIAKITLGDNATINFDGTPQDGQIIVFLLTQDATGSRVVTWDVARYRESTDLPLSISTTPDALDYYTFRYHATDDKFDLLQIVKGF